jgi:hypothetical protein
MSTKSKRGREGEREQRERDREREKAEREGVESWKEQERRTILVPAFFLPINTAIV